MVSKKDLYVNTWSTSVSLSIYYHYVLCGESKLNSRHPVSGVWCAGAAVAIAIGSIQPLYTRSMYEGVIFANKKILERQAFFRTDDEAE